MLEEMIVSKVTIDLDSMFGMNLPICVRSAALARKAAAIDNRHMNNGFTQSRSLMRLSKNLPAPITTLSPLLIVVNFHPAKLAEHFKPCPAQ